MKIVRDEDFCIILWELITVMKNRNERSMIAQQKFKSQIFIWQFVLDVLVDGEHTNVISWVSPSIMQFTIHCKKRFVDLWNKRRNSQPQTPYNVWRSLDYYSNQGTFPPILKKCLGDNTVWSFTPDILQAILMRPVDNNEWRHMFLARIKTAPLVPDLIRNYFGHM